MENTTKKPDNREYTLKFIPHQGGDVRSLRISMRAIKYSAAAFCAGALLFVGAFGYSTYNASLVSKDKAELNELRQVNHIQQEQILQLSKKTASMQTSMEQLEQLENEVRQITGVEPKAADDGQNKGQGGPMIMPNAENLSETLDMLNDKAAQHRSSLDALREALMAKKVQMDITPSIWPTNGEVSSHYGLRWGGSDFHPGLDIAADTGTPVMATADGVVVDSGWNSGGYGNMVDIDHGNGIVTRYAHNSALAVQAGMSVKKGQVIAYVGNTGFSTGPHLHYEIRVNGKPVNPENYL